MRSLAAVVAVLLAAVLLTSEAVMQPSGSERASLYGVFALAAAVTVALGIWLRAESRRSKSLSTVLVLIAASSAIVTAATIGLSSITMFISTHDLRLVLAALLLGVGLGLALAVTVARSITKDLESLENTVDLVSEGDLGTRSRLRRGDELGRVGVAVDDMIDRLEAAESGRARDEQMRRDFLAAVSHDLRTPLAAMTAALEALEDGIADDPTQLYKAMVVDVDGMTRLVDDLSTLASVEAGGIRPELVDLVELADETVEALSVLAHAKGVELVTSSAEDATVLADPEALTRVLRNLVGNAIRHSPSDDVVAIEIVAFPDTVLTVVSDHGDGFPDDFRAVAFDRFSRGDPARGGSGSGLGLAIAKGVVDAHGGEIWIGEGPGGDVRFSLPRWTLHASAHN